MSFTSIWFPFFLSISVFVYYIIPTKYSFIWLAAASLVSCALFDVYWGVITIILCLFSYYWGILLETVKQKKALLIVGILVPSAALLTFKFAKSLIAPIGISYYVLRIIAYLVSVYNGKIRAHKCIVKYFLFVSFFPMLSQGPIERPDRFFSQIESRKTFDFEQLKSGIMLIIWGYALKFIAADRLSIFVNSVYLDISSSSGSVLAIAALLYSLQLYCDFSACTCIALGSAEMFGIKLTDNFNAPFLSSSITELWRNWHITLTDWLREYIYFPLGGSRKGTYRKYLNIIIVFLVSGLWHGNGFGFLIWGFINGLYQVAESSTLCIRKKINSKLSINESSPIFKLLCSIRVFLLFSLSFIFFRLPDVKDSWLVISRIFSLAVSDDNLSVFQYGVSAKAFILLAVFIILLFIADISKRKKQSIRSFILRKHDLIQVLVISLSITAILIFGIYGAGFDASGFIYGGF